MDLWQIVFWAGLAALLVLCMILRPRRLEPGETPSRLTLSSDGAWMLLLIGLGVLLRVTYAIYTGVTTRQHDVYTIEQAKGHAGYIYWFFQNLRLPDFDPSSKSQFYHPPLHHFLAGLWMRLQVRFGTAEQQALENVQVLTELYSCLCLPVFAKLLRKFRLSGPALLLPLAVLCFTPEFAIMGGDINNDMLMNLLVLCAFTAAVCWYEKPTFWRIGLTALFMGLGMMAKLSAALAAPAIALLFLFRFFDRKKERGTIFLQFVLFAAICCPLGLWWPLYCKFRWDIPLGYVPRLSDSSTQFVGMHPALERLFGFGKAFASPFIAWEGKYGHDYNEFNVFAGLLKTTLFDEYTLFRPEIKTVNTRPLAQAGLNASKLMFRVNLVLIAASLFAAVRECILGIGGDEGKAAGAAGAAAAKGAGAAKKLDAWRARLLPVSLLVLAGVVLISYVSFCFGFPHTCTMNARYTVPVTYAGLALLGLFLKREEKNEVLGKNKMIAAFAVVTVFCVCGMIVILAVGKQ